MWIATGVTVAATTYSSISASNAANAKAGRAIQNAETRFANDKGIAEQQFDEQESLALTEMTDVTREFAKAKATQAVVQAESGVGGNVQKRLEADLRTKESETKGKVAKEIDTNVINIAQGMLAKKIDTEALINEANSQKKSTGTILLEAGLKSAASGLSAYSAAGGFKAGTKGTQTGGNFRGTNNRVDTWDGISPRGFS